MWLLPAWRLPCPVPSSFLKGSREAGICLGCSPLAGLSVWTGFPAPLDRGNLAMMTPPWEEIPMTARPTPEECNPYAWGLEK